VVSTSGYHYQCRIINSTTTIKTGAIETQTTNNPQGDEESGCYFLRKIQSLAPMKYRQPRRDNAVWSSPHHIQGVKNGLCNPQIFPNCQIGVNRQSCST
jgi:hypothetical protein